MMRKRVRVVACGLVLSLHSAGCLVQALLNPEVAQPRIEGYFNEYPDETTIWANWFQGELDDWTTGK